MSELYLAGEIHIDLQIPQRYLNVLNHVNPEIIAVEQPPESLKRIIEILDLNAVERYGFENWSLL